MKRYAYRVRFAIKLSGISQTSYRQQQKAGRDVLFVCSACNEEEVTFMVLKFIFNALQCNSLQLWT